MTKKTSLTLSLSCILLFLWGCKELPPVIDFSEKAFGLIDTNYVVGSVPTPVKKMIFVEDLTGVRCNNCPKAAIKVHQIDSTYPGNVVSMAVYPFALATLTTAWPGFEVLNTTIADDIFKDIYNNPIGIPAGGINRKRFPGEKSISLSVPTWSGFADIVKNEESQVVLTSEMVHFDTTAKKARFKVKVVFAKKYDTLVHLSVFLIENKIISKQTMVDGSLNDKYQHNHVLRKAITNFSGVPLRINAAISGNYEAGRTFEKEFETDIDSKWKKENCAFVILVNRFDDKSKEVLQAAELDLQ